MPRQDRSDLLTNACRMAPETWVRIA
jgi:hypothetical protein